MRLLPHIERTIVPLQIPRRTLALLLLVAFAAGATAAAWSCVLFLR